MKLIAYTEAEGGTWKAWPKDIKPVHPQDLIVYKCASIRSYHHWYMDEEGVTQLLPVHALAFQVRDTVWVWDSINRWRSKSMTSHINDFIYSETPENVTH